MTLEEAEREWDSLIWHVAIKSAQHGIEMAYPDDHYRSVFLYECMAGDYAGAARFLKPGLERLKFWADKFRQVRGAGPELDRFMVARINEARRGK